MRPEPVVEFQGTLGRAEFSVVRTRGERRLTIGDWSTTLTPETRLRHRHRWLFMEIRVSRPGLRDFVHRYRIHWFLQLYGPLETAADYLTAELDDPGLEMVTALGGTSDWTDREPPGGGAA